MSLNLPFKAKFSVLQKTAKKERKLQGTDSDEGFPKRSSKPNPVQGIHTGWPGSGTGTRAGRHGQGDGDMG